MREIEILYLDMEKVFRKPQSSGQVDAIGRGSRTDNR